MGDVDDFIAAINQRSRTVLVCPRGDLVTEHEQLVADLQAAQDEDGSLARSTKVRELAEKIAAVEADIEQAQRAFTLHSVSRREWADLLRKHPPSKKDLERGIDHDPATFPPAAFAACCDDVTMAQAVAIAENLVTGEWIKIWNGLLMLNIGQNTVPKSEAASAVLRANGQSGATSGASASLAASSSDDNDEQ